jgi:hypothetical protein
MIDFGSAMVIHSLMIQNRDEIKSIQRNLCLRDHLY